MTLEEEYPEIADARTYTHHRKYQTALEIYVEILPSLQENTPIYAEVLLEYALCLLESVVYSTELNYKKMLQHKNVKVEDVDEDIEIVWESFEVCRNFYESSNDKEKLCIVHKSLGDVLCFNNNFSEGILEYKKSLEHCKSDEFCIEIVECMADSYKSLENYDEANLCYQRIKDAYKKKGDEEMCSEIETLMNGLQMIKENKVAVVNVEEKGEPKDINHLKRNK